MRISEAGKSHVPGALKIQTPRAVKTRAKTRIKPPKATSPKAATPKTAAPPKAASPKAATPKTAAPPTAPTDPIDKEFQPAVDALKRERLAAEADRDSGLKDRDAYKAWAAQDRERRRALLQSQIGASEASIRAQREASDQRLAAAVGSTLGRLGMGSVVAGEQGFTDALGGVGAATAVADAGARQSAARSAAETERVDYQSRADTAYGDSLAHRAALAYGRRSRDLDARDVEIGAAKSSARTAAEKAAFDRQEKEWMRRYLGIKEDNDTALARERNALTARGQDISVATADADRAQAAAIAEAKLAEKASTSTGGYRGRTAPQYNTHRNQWLNRTRQALTATKNTTPASARAEALRHLDVLVTADIRPMDAAMIVEAASGGGLLTVSDYNQFFTRHFGANHAATIMKSIFPGFGAPGAPAGAPGDQQDRRRKLVIKKSGWFVGTYEIGADGRERYIGPGDLRKQIGAQGTVKRFKPGIPKP